MTETDYLIDGEPMPTFDAPDEPPKVSVLEAQPAAVIGLAVTVAEAIIATAVPLPEWLKLILGGIVALGGILGIRSKVTPTARPRLDDDTPLTP